MDQNTNKLAHDLVSFIDGRPDRLALVYRLFDLLQDGDQLERLRQIADRPDLEPEEKMLIAVLGGLRS